MVEKFKSQARTVKGLLVTIVAIVLLERLLTFGVGFFLPDKKGAVAYTPEHFQSVALPPSPSAVFNGVADQVGSFSAILVTVLGLLYLAVFFPLYRSIWHRDENGGINRAEGWWQKTTDIDPGKTGLAVGLVLILALPIKLVSLVPVDKNAGFGGQVGGALVFPVKMNLALWHKSRFEENKYRELLFDVFMRDKDEFFAFAETAYWAHFASENYHTRMTYRNRYGVEYLYPLFEADSLDEETAYRLYQLARSSGMHDKAADIVNKLASDHPQNETYQNHLP